MPLPGRRRWHGRVDALAVAQCKRILSEKISARVKVRRDERFRSVCI
ncbi:hypothetical protein [Streptomyces chengmaiensis]|nr:hypothetical protein [Streptomyces chengmaiensis]